MTPSPTRARRPLAIVLRAALLLALPGLLVAGAASSDPAGAQGSLADRISIEVAPTTDLADGDQVDIAVQASGGVTITAVKAIVCRAGQTYTTEADLLSGYGKCPLNPVSSSAENGTSLGVFPGGAAAKGRLRVGIGATRWEDRTGTEVTMTCDPQDPCPLVFEVRTSAGRLYATRDLTFRDGDPLVGCGGAAPGALATEGPDRILRAWADWTYAACALPGAQGAPTRNTGSGEGPALAALGRGAADLAYAAVSPSTPGFEAPQMRSTVGVPIALNAVVVAVGGGWLDGSVKVPYGDVKLTLDEVATLVATGRHEMERLHGAAIRERNPQLHPLSLADAGEAKAYAALDSTSQFLTTHLDELRPDLWVDRHGAPRQVSPWLAVADPSFENVLDLYSGRPALVKSRDTAWASAYPGAMWVVTDLATATQLGLTPVSIENARGDFVAPTPEAMAAAVPQMEVSPAGGPVPDPYAAAADGPTPYPLTYVEHAVAPAEPLLTPECAPRSESQALLSSWLTFITSEAGQAELAPGFVPLVPELLDVAAVSIAEVGALPVTGDCAGVVPPGEDPPTDPLPPAPTSEGFDLGTGFGAGGFGATTPAPGGGFGATPPAPLPGPGGSATELASASSQGSTTMDVPGFGGSSGPSWVLAVVALVLIGVLTSGMALGAAGLRPGTRGPAPGAPPTGPGREEAGS